MGKRDPRISRWQDRNPFSRVHIVSVIMGKVKGFIIRIAYSSINILRTWHSTLRLNSCLVICDSCHQASTLSSAISDVFFTVVFFKLSSTSCPLQAVISCCFSLQQLFNPSVLSNSCHTPHRFLSNSHSFSLHSFHTSSLSSTTAFTSIPNANPPFFVLFRSVDSPYHCCALKK